MDTFWLVIAKPLVLLVFWLLVAAIAWALDKVIPDGPVKRFLWKERGASAKRAAPPAAPTSKPLLTPAAARRALRDFRRG
jgi:hypothetical protein